MTLRGIIAVACFWTVLGGVSLAPASAQDVIFLVRHAEPEASPPADPPLSAEGKRRAEALRDALREAGVTAIVTSSATRTKETAKPLATALGITPKVDPMADAKALVDKIRALPGGGNVLVVGHSDTIPELLKALGHSSSVSIGAAEFDNLFVVTPGDVTHPRVIRLRYKP
jgi:broad specificity phosphatase PhoE